MRSIYGSSTRAGFLWSQNKPIGTADANVGWLAAAAAATQRKIENGNLCNAYLNMISFVCYLRSTSSSVCESLWGTSIAGIYCFRSCLGFRLRTWQKHFSINTRNWRFILSADASQAIYSIFFFDVSPRHAQQNRTILSCQGMTPAQSNK